MPNPTVHLGFQLPDPTPCLFGIGLGRTQHLSGIPRCPDTIAAGSAAFWHAIERAHTLGITMQNAGWEWNGRTWTAPKETLP